MGNAIDLTGIRYEKLVVIERKQNDKHGSTRWLCICDCGKFCTVLSGNLKSGKQQSCGCLRHTGWTKTHGESYGNRLYEIWTGMKTRCYNSKVKCFKHYGGRGIIVSDEWKSNYESFRDWSLSNGYQDNLTIDRTDNDKGYNPDNCRWTTAKGQANNTRNNRIFNYNGEMHTMSEWAEILGITYNRITKRVYKGWNIEQIINTPLRRNRIKEL